MPVILVNLIVYTLFDGVEGEIEVIGITTCGGCPGKRAVTKAAEMVKRGADTISIMLVYYESNPIGFACPHALAMKNAIAKKLGDSVFIIDYTH